MLIGSRQDLDRAVVQYFDQIALEGAHPSFGNKLLAALIHIMPELGATIKDVFPGGSRSLQGWHRLVPSHT
eukprot:6771926-Karenia_brevis.AAC.1